VVIAINVTLLDLSVLPEIIEFRPHEVLLHHVVLLVEGVPFGSGFFEERLVLVSIEKGQDDVEGRQYNDVDALVEELLLGVGLGEGDSCSEDGGT
jgi:hypothetical protein